MTCLLLALWLPAASALALSGDGFVVLSYHDVQDNPERDRLGDAVTIATADLVAQFAWLHEHHYRPVSLDDIRAARAGLRTLPERAVLLTFDDGYASVYTRVFPLLRLFGYPAVVAPVTSWVEQPVGSDVEYGSLTIPRGGFVTWAQLREMADSGLVEIASHGHDLHRSVAGNPQGSLQPAATTHAYDGARGGYEDEEAWRKRVGGDLERSAQLIERRTGYRPRAIVWPYGRYNDALTDLAVGLGMTIGFDLGDHGHNSARDRGVIRRAYLTHGATLGDLVDALAAPARRPAVRAVQIDLDYVHDPDPAQRERNLDALLDRIKALEVNTVYLQAFADPDGDGVADALYFPNRHLPVRADLFNRVAWQLATRVGVRVYAWLPTLAYRPPPDSPLNDHGVMRDTTHDEASPRYARLSPFSAAAREFVGDLYEDLARHTYVDGLLFHDDAVLGDDEDASPAAIEVYAGEWGLPPSLAEIRADPALLEEWTRRKTEALHEWNAGLAARARAHLPHIKTARNLYAPVALDAAAEARFSQSLPSSLARYDYTVIMAMPYLEGQSRPFVWLERLLTSVARHDTGLDRTVFELQSVDWRSRTPVDTAILRRQMELLQRLGARHLAYYPDDFIAGHPDITGIRPAMSVETYPYPE